MKIVVIGPQNTGKSTFVKDFLLEFPDYKTTEKTYRDIVTENNLDINQKTNEKSQALIMDFLYKEVVENEIQNIIFDRCVIDNYIYSAAANLPKSFLEINKRKMLEHLKYIDMIFFIPTSVSVNLVNDDMRDTDKLFIDKVNKIFLETLFYISNISHVPIKVISGDRYNRIKQVKTILT